jgi:CBS domain containing-hemolysin-like protein
MSIFMDKPPPQETIELSPFKKFLHFLGISRIPDSIEDLEQEIQELIEEGEEHGLITTQEGLMINSILELKDTFAREIMTPRGEMISAAAEADTSQVIELIRNHGFSRIPIYSNNQDHIIGIIHAKDLLAHANIPNPPLAKDITNPAYFVSENEKIVDLLKSFQTKNLHMAIVTDEFGITRGLVTLEDILEEIVGEIADEYDKDEPPWRVVDDTLITDAKVHIEEVEDFFHVSLPEGPYDSIGGLLTHQLGHVPHTGTSLSVGELRFTVMLATKRRILTVQIKRTTSQPDGETAG